MVAIILSVYKKDKALPVYWAVQSLLHQTYKDLLIFIRLDGEIEPSVDTLLRTLQNDNRNILISKNSTNYGLSYSLNKLIDVILSEYPHIQFIARMDADDICHLDRIRRQVKFLNENPSVDILGSACQEFGIYNKIIIKDESDTLIKRNILKVTPFIHPSVIFRTKVFADGNRYPQNTVLSEDLAFWLDLSLNNYNFHNINDVLLFYRINNTTLTRRTGIKKAFSELKIRLSYLVNKKENIMLNGFYIIGHFGIRIMPIFLVRMIYRLLR